MKFFFSLFLRTVRSDFRAPVSATCGVFAYFTICIKGCLAGQGQSGGNAGPSAASLVNGCLLRSSMQSHDITAVGVSCAVRC